MTSRSADQIWAAIVATPGSYELRREFATAIEQMDPRWSRFIHNALGVNEYLHPAASLEAQLEAPFRSYGDVRCMFHQGFVESIVTTPEVFLKHGDALLKLGPIVEVILRVPGATYHDTWNTYLPSLVECPTLGHVRHLTFWGHLSFDCESFHRVINSRFTDSLLILDASQGFVSADAPSEEDAMWAALFESPVFRRMIDWGFTRSEYTEVAPMDHVYVTRMLTERQIGDRMRVEKPRSQYYATTSYDPMPPEDRAIEEKYGYIPRLHANNWGATVIDVLRGNKPDYPAGTPVTEAMYAVPPPIEEKVASDD